MDGIDPAVHDCVIAPDNGTIADASVDIVPIIPDSLDPQLNVSFVTASNDPGCKAGAIVAFNPTEWRLAYVDSRVALIDGSSHSGMSIVVLASGLDNILASVADATLFISLSPSGVPGLTRDSRARLMHEAILGGIHTQASAGAVPYGIALPASSPSEASQEGPRRKSRSRKPKS